MNAVEGVLLALYAALMIVVAMAAVRERLRTTSRRRTPPPGLDRLPIDIAYLEGGAHLATCAAVSAMYVRGHVAVVAGERVVPAHRIAPGTDPLEVAILWETAGRGDFGAFFHRDRSVKAALTPTVSRLLVAGLLRSTQERQRMIATAFAMFGVCALGVLRHKLGIEDGTARTLWTTGIGLSFYLAIALCFVPRRTRSGRRVLAALRSDHHDLSPASRPDWTLRGPHAAALGVGLFGVAALWASAPELASAIGLQQSSGSDNGSSSGSSGGGSGCGSGGGGDGGGGGGGCGG